MLSGKIFDTRIFIGKSAAGAGNPINYKNPYGTDVFLRKMVTNDMKNCYNNSTHEIKIKDSAASNGVSNLQRCQAAGYLILAAVAKCLQAATWLVARGNKT